MGNPKINIDLISSWNFYIEKHWSKKLESMLVQLIDNQLTKLSKHDNRAMMLESLGCTLYVLMCLAYKLQIAVSFDSVMTRANEWAVLRDVDTLYRYFVARWAYGSNVYKGHQPLYAEMTFDALLMMTHLVAMCVHLNIDWKLAMLYGAQKIGKELEIDASISKKAERIQNKRAARQCD